MKFSAFQMIFQIFILAVVFKESSQIPRPIKALSYKNVARTNHKEKLEKMSTMDVITDINSQNDLSDLFEGDIDLKEEKRRNSFTNKKKRDTQRDQRYLWHTGIVPYEISYDLENFAFMIEGALQEISSKTCIKFVKRSTEENWIYFVRRSGCWSSVGKLYWRPGFQEISLGSGCLNHETVLHEVLHALGFWHEQSRPDRGQYIEIFWENIQPGEESNFKRYSHAEADLLGVQYDYSSVMHYGSKAFSKNGKETMKPIRETQDMLGIATELSSLDVIQLNALYDCRNDAANGWSNWSGYSPCNSDCLKQRQRFCRNSNKTFCEGINDFGVQTEIIECKKDETECYAPIDGHWGPWGSWSTCSKSCGQGSRMRSRECNDPSPKYDGEVCEGASIDYDYCKLTTCGLGEDDCEYESNGFCHWQNDENNNDGYRWFRINGPTPSRYTGPTEDHSSGNGHYIYLEASSPATQGNKGRLLSKSFAHGTEKCMTFYYFMYGQDMGTLRVILYGIASRREEILWQATGDQGSAWKEHKIFINSEEDFKIIFEGVRGIGFKGDIAIDDVYIKNGSCNQSGDSSLVDEQSLLISTAKPRQAIIEVGCYSDVGSIDGKRPFPQYISFRDVIDWNDLSKTISSCALKAKELGYKYFAVEFYGECWFGPENEVNYTRDGLTDDCWNGVGKAQSMMVYKWSTSSTSTQ